MYELAYHLNADPFRLSPDHRFCFRHKSYSRNKAYLDYALNRGEGFVMITGAPGSGKTTLLNDVLTNADKTNTAMARIVTTQLDANDLLRMVAFSFKLNTQSLDKASILHYLEIFLIKQYQQRRHSLLVIDEAQDLDKTALEEIRLLTNLQIDGRSLLQVFLVGQNALLDMIQDPTMEQLHQRLIASSHLESMKAEETEIYVIHRLRKAGWRRDPLISRGALRRIHIFSRGVPRIVNQLCSRFLLYGSVENKHRLDSNDVQEVIKELCHEHLAPITGEQSPEEFFNNESFKVEATSVKQYDQEYLDSTAFCDEQTAIKPLDKNIKSSKVQDIHQFTPNTSEKGIDVIRMSKSNKEKKPISPPSSRSRVPIRIKSEENNDIKRASSLSDEEDGKRAAQAYNSRHFERRPPLQQPYALTGFLMLLLISIIVFAYPDPAGKQDTTLDTKQIPEKVSSHQPALVLQNKKIDMTSIRHAIEKSLTSHALSFTQTKQGFFKLQLNIDDQFSWGSSIMSHTLQSKLGYLARVMHDQPQAVIHIIGHSDPTGSQARNNTLSKLRAKVVANYLVLQGIPQHRLTTDGRGSRELVNKANPPVNRRVDLLIETVIPGGSA